MFVVSRASHANGLALGYLKMRGRVNRTVAGSSKRVVFLELLVALALSTGCGARTELLSEASSGGGGDGTCAVVCDEPPAPACVSATTLRTSSAPGACTAGICSYAHVDTGCPSGCSSGSCTLTRSILSISAGGEHTCAVTANGAVQCWGLNSVGQLGNDSTMDSNVPVPVTGLSSGAVAVTAGESHTCALMQSGGIKCWGDNFNGELGIGSNVESHVPVDVPSLLPGFRSVSAGDGYTCAVTSQGALQCWGENFQGELGSGSSSDSNRPVDVAGFSSGVAAVSSGRAGVACATTSQDAGPVLGIQRRR